MNAQAHYNGTQLLIIDRYADGIHQVPRDVIEEWIIIFAERYREIYEEGIHDIEDIEVRLYKVVIPI